MPGQVGLAFSDYAQKEFDTPPARWCGFQPDDKRRCRSFSFDFGGTDTFANAGIEGLFANIGFSGFWDLRFAFGVAPKWVANVKSVPLGREGLKCRHEGLRCPS